MEWIVLTEEKGMIKLISTKKVDGILPKGSYLTIENGKDKTICVVEKSQQHNPFSPDPLIIDMNLKPLIQDRKSQNIIYVYRIKDISNRDDGLIDFVKPYSIARRSTQEEVLKSMYNGVGPIVFPASVYGSNNVLMKSYDNDYIHVALPEDMFYHQMLICGKTGSGKTVSMKYFVQYFAEKIGGAVLAINVKEADFLRLDLPSVTKKQDIINEWNSLKINPHGISNFSIYYPANSHISPKKRVTKKLTQKVTLSTSNIDPESLIGVMSKLSQVGAQMLPNIFRFWVSRNKSSKFIDFIQYFENNAEEREFGAENERGDQSTIKLPRGTINNILRSLNEVSGYFDNPNAIELSEKDILQKSKVSVIDVTGKNCIKFGGIILRELLSKIVKAKDNKEYNIPVLIVIDEVHQFYNNESTEYALGDLDTICRTGRSMKIGVIFSSQNPTDIPKGLESVINTKIFFNTDLNNAKKIGVNLNKNEVSYLKKGYACCQIYEMPQLNIIKFPLSLCGVFENE